MAVPSSPLPIKSLVRLIQDEAPGAMPRLIGMATLSGIANALVLAIINTAAGMAQNSQYSDRLLILFFLAMALYALSQRYILVRSVQVIEASLHRVRLRFSERLRVADLEPLERIGRSTIYASISKEIVTISQSAPNIVIACQSALMVLFSAMYLAKLSMTAFLLTVLVTATGVSIHFQRSKGLQRDIREILNRENSFFDLLTQVLDGFKEVKLHEGRRNALLAELQEVSSSVAELKIDYSTRFSTQFVFSSAFFYILLGVIVFILPRLSGTYSDVVMKATSSVLFIIGPLNGVISAIPSFTAVDVAINKIRELETVLAKANLRPETEESAGPKVLRDLFQEIQFVNVMYQYTDATGAPLFSVGPLNLKIRAGEIIFLIGGNGSGKSTLLKLLTGLYYPTSGQIVLDGAPVGASNYPEYRNLFSSIFSDYHLFERLYGLPDVDPEHVRALLTITELERKTALKGDRWVTLDLSSGQRRRLALVVAELEGRPIQVFDELAADQDPHFRQYLYEVLFPNLKKREKTIIAATHDDRYFRIADRVLKMEYGALEELTVTSSAEVES